LLNRFLCVRRHELFCVRTVDIVVTPPLVTVKYQFGDQTDLGRLNRERHDYDDEATEYATERLEAGDRLVLGECEGDVVIYCWLCFGELELEYQRFMPLGQNAACVYKVFVVDDFRGRRLYPGAYGFMQPYLQKRGDETVLTQSWTGNTASQAAM